MLLHNDGKGSLDVSSGQTPSQTERDFERAGRFISQALSINTALEALDDATLDGLPAGAGEQIRRLRQIAQELRDSRATAG